MSWTETLPLVVLGPIFLAMLIVGVEVGYRGHRWLARRREDGVVHGGQDYLLSAVLGLLALLLGFTFSLALNRYDARRELVVQEANAIGTTWLRVQILEEPNRAAMSALLRRYVDARIAWSEADRDPAVLARANALQGQLWTATGAAVRGDSSPLLSRGMMDAMNESFDLASARTAARAAHVPIQVLGVLILYSALSTVMLGYILAGGGQPHRVATGLLLVLLTLALVMIVDLDRPRGGAIHVSQQPLYDLKASMR
jgi:prepilin signal peptidase PulO-like enzyme (type II secretory pathway)